MIETRLDLRDKDSWKLENTEIIAEMFGYVADVRFQQALGEFIEKTVTEARVTKYLGIFAQSFLREYQPPLTKNNST